MIGLALDLGAEGGPAIVLDRLRDGVEATHQNAIVNVLTRAGSDVASPERGTGLSRAVVTGAISSFAGARHAANFAALRTMTYLRTQSPPPEMAELRLEPISFVGRFLQLDITIVDANGQIVVFKNTFR